MPPDLLIKEDMIVGNTTQSGFPVLLKGAVKEEVWDWRDLEAMARTGRLSPESLIFFADENKWKKAADTDLADCLEAQDPAAPTGSTNRELDTEYESVLENIRENPGDQAPILQAAEMALAMGKDEAARDHYQQALELTPYHPRIVQEAKRNLPLARWKTLRFLDKPPHIWEEPFHLAAYPLSRGMLYWVVPAVVIAALSWSPWTIIPAALLAGLWMMEIIAAASAGRAKPPPWDELVPNRGRTPLKRLAALAGVAFELYLPFIAIASVLVATGRSARSGVFDTMTGSPVMTVMMVTVSLLYLPAALMLAAASAKARVREVIDPRRVAAVIRKMEGEYLAALGSILLSLGLVFGIASLAGIVPFAGRVVWSAAAAYLVPAYGLVLGRLYSRFREQLEEPPSCASPGA